MRDPRDLHVLAPSSPTRRSSDLDELRGATCRVGGPDASLRLHLNVLPLFAQQRLFPRLPDLRRQHPESHIDIDTLAHGEARLGDGLDAAIALARADRKSTRLNSSH